MATEASVANSYATRLALLAQARTEAIQQTFNSELFTLTSMMGPISEGPEWPSDPAWLAFQHGSCAGIISDGLSDPWVEKDKSSIGLGLEVFVESPDISLAAGESMMALADTWLFPMTAEISHTLASYNRLCTKLLAGEPLALRFNIEHIKDGRGLVGALLHIPRIGDPRLVTGPGAITLIAATLLTQDELRWLQGRKETGREELLDKIYLAGIGTQSLVQRPSVV